MTSKFVISSIALVAATTTFACAATTDPFEKYDAPGQALRQCSGGNQLPPLLQPPGGVSAATVAFNGHRIADIMPILGKRRILGSLMCYPKRGAAGYMIGLRGAIGVMGGSAWYDDRNKTIEFTKDGNRVKLYVGKWQMSVNGVQRPIDVPPVVYNNLLYVPIRLVTEGLGGSVLWSQTRHRAEIRYLPAPVAVAAAVPPAPDNQTVANVNVEVTFPAAETADEVVPDAP